MYHQHGSQVEYENQNINFVVGENLNYVQVGNGYLEFEIKVRKTDNSNFIFADDNGNEVIRLVNYVFALTIHDARVSQSAGLEAEQNKFVGPISKVLMLITQSVGDLSTYFDIIDESEDDVNNSSLTQILINDHTKANRGAMRRHLPLESVFGFFKSFGKVTKSLGLELEVKLSNRKRNILITTLGDTAVNIAIKSVNLHLPTKIPNTETQRFFNEAFTKSFTLSFESWTTDRKPVNAGKELQVGIGSASNTSAALYFIAAHQKTQRIDLASTKNPPKKISNSRFNNAFFLELNVKNTLPRSMGLDIRKITF